MPSFRLAPLAAAALIAIGVSASPAKAEPREFTLDPEHISIGFLVHHLGLADVLGMFREASGSFVYDEEANTVSDVEITIQTASVFTNHERRDEHLRGPDFLNVKEYPTMTFTADEAVKTGESKAKLKGELTMLGVTKPLTLDVTYKGGTFYPFGDGHYAVGISARGTVKRTDYGMTYAAANGWVGDEIHLIIEFEAKRQEEE
ncbi:YceI family protein [Ferruginivarius sediminum]|uniref:YceI family protein n=1 Tax=Ferruginivarius sediminum TaxID=2661937 RepID=A0A369TA58_9PROT|nr:YceI family protein [Ferruginivarius sediminum]RDD61384.1 YceI family protein [Ferruginivarius sediminum]